METECDFMEIDNNIASRLQVPCLTQQKESEIPETLPVPMLANFDHFQPDNDEKESSFMTNIDAKQESENAGSREPLADFENGEVSESSGEKHVDFDYASSDVFLKNEGFIGNDEEAASSFFQGQQEDQSDGSVSLFCADSKYKSAEETRSNDRSMSANDSFSDNEPRTEEKVAQSDQQCDQVNVGDTILCSDHGVRDPLQVGNQTSHPLVDSESDYADTGRTNSLDREFVFVNQDGTAQVSPLHPLEESDDYFY